MCLLIVASRVLAEWPLVVAANRDERYDRAAQPVGLLRSTPPRTLGGRDLLAGGTWLATNEHGVVAGLTNKPVSEGRDPAKRSRGMIPLALTAARTAEEAVSAFVAENRADVYNPCWVLVGDRTSLFALDLTGNGPVGQVALPPGLHVLENKALGAPSAKVDYVTARLRRDVVRSLGDVSTHSAQDLFVQLRAILADHRRPLAPVDETETAQRASQVSACCVHMEDYGTRSSLVVRVPDRVDQPPELWASAGPSCTTPLRPVGFEEG